MRSRCSRLQFIRTGGAVCLAVALVAAAASNASAQAIQHATFTIGGTSELTLSGAAFGINDANGTNPPGPTVISAALQPQQLLPVSSFKTTYSGTISADLTFDLNTRAVTGIRYTGGSIIANASGNWKPGNWNGTGWPTDGGGQLQTEAASYGGQLATFATFATRGLTLSLNSGNTVFPVAGGTFVPTTGTAFQFSGGFNALNAPDLGAVSNDPLSDFRNIEINSSLVEPATKILYDGSVVPNENAGRPYPGGAIWRYVIGKDANNNPVYDMTAAGLAPAFNISGDPLIDNYWDPDSDFDPNNPATYNGTRPMMVRRFDGAGVWSQLDFGNTLQTGGTAAASAFTQAAGGANNFNLGMILEVNAPSAFRVGDFIVSLRLSQGSGLNVSAGQLQANKTANLLPGDTNFDGKVNLVDVQVVGGAWSSTGTPGLFLTGDANGDGVVNLVDVQVVGGNWNAQANGGNGDGGSLGGSAVPEPSSVVLASLCGCLALLGLRRRK